MMGEKIFNPMFLPLVFLAFSLFHVMALGRTQTFTGKAFDGGGTLAYIEERDITHEGKVVIKRLTTCPDPDKRDIRYLHSDYAPLPQF